MSTQTKKLEELAPKHEVVSRDEWLAARKELLREEKELTRQQDRLNALRRDLPWVKVEKQYVFEGPSGLLTLAQLFEGRSQLIVQHFMFGPDWSEGCIGCSFGADHVDGARRHFEHHDLSFAAVSRAPYPNIEEFKRRMGWKFQWVSSFDSDFNFDYNVSATPEELASGKMFYNFATIDSSMDEMPGVSVFYKDENGCLYHTYSAYARGDERGLGAYMFLDLTPKGRNENGPNFNLMDWVKHHDKYEEERPIALDSPRIVRSKPMILAGIDRRYRFDRREGIPDQWDKFGPVGGSLSGKVGCAFYGVSSHMYDGGESFRYMTAVEVGDLFKLPDDYSAIRLPAQRYAVFQHRQHISKICDTIHAAWSKWLPENGYEPADSPDLLERYGESFDPATGFGDVELWIPIRD